MMDFNDSLLIFNRMWLLCNFLTKVSTHETKKKKMNNLKKKSLHQACHSPNNFEQKRSKESVLVAEAQNKEHLDN